jgi:hypothetical protein
MAVVVRRYAPIGPTDEMLDRFVDPNGAELSIATTYPTTSIDINVDNAVGDLIETLDEYMAQLGYAVSAAGSPRQVFRYVATGAEANPFPVSLPATRASANYNVFVTMGGPSANAIKEFRPLVSTFTTTGFSIELGGAIDAGDIFMILVEDLT